MKCKRETPQSSYTTRTFSQWHLTCLVNQCVCFVNNVCVRDRACVDVCACVCVMGELLRFCCWCLKLPCLSLSSGEHNPYMTLSSWLTVPPSRLFHPTQNNIVHLPPPASWQAGTQAAMCLQRHRLRFVGTIDFGWWFWKVIMYKELFYYSLFLISVDSSGSC